MEFSVSSEINVNFRYGPIKELMCLRVCICEANTFSSEQSFIFLARMVVLKINS